MVEQFFKSSGPLLTALPKYEYRPQQQQMASSVEQAIEKGKTLLVEAGTGTGKSLAYLVPALFFAVEQKKRVIISTHTIHLQEQLLHKDLPILKKALPFSFRAVLVKGRGNYISLRRLAKAKRETIDLFERASDFLELDQLQTWTLTSEDGSIQDMFLQPSASLWEQVRSDSDNCMGRKCPTYQRCFYYSARRQIDQAHLLIVNHALFFSDLALKGSDYAILPTADCIIFDEAHALEEVATKHLGFSLSKSHIRYLLTRLYHPKKKKGILVTQKKSDGLIELVEHALKETELVFSAFHNQLRSFRHDQETNTAHRIHQPYWVDNLLHETLMRIYHGLDQRRGVADSQEEELEFGSWMRKISDLQCQLDTFFEQSLNDYVYWIEPNFTNHEKTILTAAPVEVSTVLRQRLFEKNPRIILTSATLGTGGSFSYIRERLGINQAEELMLDSPFDYVNQMTLYIPHSMPSPYDTEIYFNHLVHQIKEYLQKTKGRAFVLFTSYSLMNQVYEIVLPWLKENGMDSFKQGDGIPRHPMLQAFRKSSNGVLFGTDSFWSGVDVQGEALSNVIITKLPFAVPDHPMNEARCEKIKEQGRDPFLEFSLPQAVMKFKQGFGRLIRTKSDTGMVVVLDSRILTRNYGKSFLDSLPECKIKTDV